MNGAAYLQLKGWVQVTPILGTFPGFLATFLLYLSTGICHNYSVKDSWSTSTIAGAVIMMICFMVVFRVVTKVITPSIEELFPFWTYISVGYVLLSLLFIEVVRWVERSKDRKK